MKQYRLLFPTVGLLAVLGWPSSAWAFHNWKRAQLPNGMTLLVVEKPEAPVVALTLLIKLGTTSDPPAKSGLATLTGRLLTEGTPQRSSEQIDQRIAALGGEFVKDINFDYTIFDWAVMKEDLAPALELLADVVQHSSFPRAEVERQRRAMIAARRAKTEDTPEALLLHYLFAPGPYGRPPSGEAASLERVAREDVVRFHQQTYRPEEAILAAAGDVTLEEIQALATKYFADWSAPEEAGAALPVVSVRKDPVALVINRPLVQASVRLVFVGAPAASPDAPALLLLAHLLGGSADSRLGQNLRERKRWVYSARCVAESFWQTDLFYIDLSVPYEVILPALQEAVREIVHLQTEPVTGGELARAKRGLVARLTFENENVQDISRFVAEHEAYTHGQERPDHMVDALGSVSADEIQRVTRQYLDPQKAVVTVVGDRQMLGKFAPVLAAGKLPQWHLQAKMDGQHGNDPVSRKVPGAARGVSDGRIP